MTDDERRNLRGRYLAVHRADRFGIDLSDLGDPADVEARVAQVLDS